MLSETARSVAKAPSDLKIVVKGPDRFREGVVDVVTFRGLARAFGFLMKRNQRPSNFDRALVRVINTNGAMAKVILEKFDTDGE